MGFEWRTEEEDWDREPEFQGSNTAVRPNRFPNLLLALVIISSLVLLGWFLSRAATDEVQERSTDLSTDILAAYALLNQAAQTNDIDLFETFLSPNNTFSRELPLDQFRYGYFLDRPFLNLVAQDLPPDQAPQVNLSPDLSRAELTSLQAYAPNNQADVDPIWLERLTLFRKVDGRWQLTRWPIDESFWGETQEIRVGLLTAEFPTRDEVQGRRLAQDIGRLLDDICQDPAITCPPNFRLKMLLVPYGQSLLDMNKNYRTLPLTSGYDAYRIFLPSPTLVGRPVDEAGYQAFYAGYASWIAAVLVQHYSQIRPVSYEVTAEFLAQWQLSPPAMPSSPGPLVEAVDSPPVPFPDQDVLLVCQGYSPATWLSYNPRADVWQTISVPNSDDTLAQMLQRAGQMGRFAPEGQGTLIRRPFTVENAQSWHNFLWLGGLTNLLETADSPALFLADANRQSVGNDQRLFYPFDGQSNPYLADTAACLSSDCNLEPLEGVPIWSPEGDKALLTIHDGAGEPQLFLGDAEGRPIHYLTDGYSPQWLDGDVFLYVGPAGIGVYKGILDSSDNLSETDLQVNIATFFSPLIVTERSRNKTITYLAVHPAQPDRIIISVNHKEGDRDNFLLIDSVTNRIHFGFAQSNLRFSHPFYFSENGRFLTIPAFGAGTVNGGWQLVVFDLERLALNWQFSTDSAYFDWSDDDIPWLLIAEEEALRLIAPEHNYERRIPHDLGCHVVGWN